MAEPSNKLCRGCNQVKPVEEFARRNDRPGGRQSKCKQCKSLLFKHWEVNNPAKRQTSNQRYKDRHPERLREQRETYRKKHQKRIQARQRQWEAANKDHVRAYQRQFQRKWLAASPLRYAKHLAYTREWRRHNREAVLRHNINRRARLLGAFKENFTREEIYERDNGTCHVCKRRVSKQNWHLDHLIPLSKGGEHSRRNVAVSHPRCNLRRKNIGPAQLRLLG